MTAASEPTIPRGWGGDGACRRVSWPGGANESPGWGSARWQPETEIAFFRLVRERNVLHGANQPDFLYLAMMPASSLTECNCSQQSMACSIRATPSLVSTSAHKLRNFARN